MDVIARVPRLRDSSAAVQQRLLDKLDEHRSYVQQTGDDLPEVRDWRWSDASSAAEAE